MKLHCNGLCYFYVTSADLEEDPFSRIKMVVKWYLSGFYKKPKVCHECLLIGLNKSFKYAVLFIIKYEARNYYYCVNLGISLPLGVFSKDSGHQLALHTCYEAVGALPTTVILDKHKH